MKTGIQLIEQERKEQIKKHGRTIERDVEENSFNQLSDAAILLIQGNRHTNNPPSHWDINIWRKMLGKKYKERLIIAGALIAAEIDRLQNNDL